jgi:hypothetical protein
MENKYRKETRYFCEFCKVYVYNNLAQKKKHELTPHHQNLLRRQLQNLTQTSKQPVSKKRLAAKIDSSKYGIEGLEPESLGFAFKASKEFVENNTTIGSTSIGEWEEVEEVTLIVVKPKEIIEDEEGVEKGFKIVEKHIKSEQVDDGEPLVFKKRLKNKNIRRG